SLHLREPLTPRAPRNVAAQEQSQQEPLGRVNRWRHREMRLQLQGLVSDSRQRRLEHLHGRVAADLGRPDDLSLEIAACRFRYRGDVAGPHPFASARSAADWPELFGSYRVPDVYQCNDRRRALDSITSLFAGSLVHANA